MFYANDPETLNSTKNEKKKKHYGYDIYKTNIFIYYNL